MQNFFQKIETLGRKSPAVGYALIGAISAGYFAWLHQAPSFADPDSFYHAKIALLMRQQGSLITEFPWLPLTSLSDNFVDQAWLYHLLLVPFTYLSNPLIGLKISAVLIASAVIVLLYHVLKKFNVKYSWAYILLLLTSTPLVFRLSLAKAAPLGVFLYLLGIYLLMKKKTWPLLVLGFIFVWTHGSWFLLFLSAGLFWVVKSLASATNNFPISVESDGSNSRYLNWKTIFNYLKRFFIGLFAGGSYRPFSAVAMGSIAGLLVNPYFPKNLIFFWQQTILIAIKGYKDIIGVGAEWYGFPLNTLISSSLLFCLMLVFALVAFAVFHREKKPRDWSLATLTLVLFLITINSRRNIEFFAPIATLFMALTISSIKPGFWLAAKEFVNIHFLSHPGRRILTVVFLTIAVSVTAANFYNLKTGDENHIAFEKYRSIAEWTNNNVPDDEVVLYENFGNFPMLLYWNEGIRGIVGLDPAFLYMRDQTAHNMWVDLKNNETLADPEQVWEQLHSRTFLVNQKNYGLSHQLNLHPDWQFVYRADDLLIYQVRK